MPKSRNSGESDAVDIWTKMEREPKNPITAPVDGAADGGEEGTEGQSQSEVRSQSAAVENSANSSIVFVGDLGCGKSTLIQSFLKPSASKDTKPTIALEYNYARKTTNGVKSVANLWEVGGDLVEPKLMEIGITRSNLTSAAVIICCDLSKPHNVLNSVLRSISAVKEIVARRVAELQATNVTVLNQIRENIANSYKGHPDAGRLRPLDVPVVLVANKHDLFRSLQASDRRLVINVLRFVAHYFGATLLTMSSSDAGMKDSYRTLVSCLGFGLPGRTACEVNADKAIFVTRGRDTFHSIMLGGTPSLTAGAAEEVVTKSKGGQQQSGLVSSELEVESYLTHKGVTRDCWGRLADLMAAVFGEPDPLSSEAHNGNAAEGKDGNADEIETGDADGSGGTGAGSNPFPESEVDDMRVVRDAALTRYVQEQERREGMLAKMNARNTRGN